MTCSMIPIRLLPQASLLLLNGLMRKSSHDGRDGVYARAQKHGLPLTKAILAIVTAECPICQQQRPILSTQYDAIPKDHQPATWRQVDYIGLLVSWKRQSFVLT